MYNPLSLLAAYSIFSSCKLTLASFITKYSSVIPRVVPEENNKIRDKIIFFIKIYIFFLKKFTG